MELGGSQCSSNDSSLPKIDLYIYEIDLNSVPVDAYYFDIDKLDEHDNPQEQIFSTSLPAYNIPGSVSPYSIYPKLTNLDKSCLRTRQYIYWKPPKQRFFCCKYSSSFQA
ncbi:hypothetical protein FHS16_005956 [Paenibacillus endophyticus]|uniref:Uncharacterized protein n=1 Tax=Paenibacillus endophyticus TaxID=1294268 RepID=A0A7W5CDT7_9BACL|nr:hypothetical protein [Paenibacillus endophyticus]MBB3155840.1 hypothetical protein [Paenibacillus endophyticus]